MRQGYCLPGNETLPALPVSTPAGDAHMKWDFDTCEGEGVIGVLAVLGLALYLAAFAPGMG